MKVSLNVSGFRELEKALAEELPKATARNVVRRAATEAMGRIESKAKARAPVQSGDLQGRIVIKPVKARRVSRTRFAKSSGFEIAVGPANAVGYKGAGTGDWNEFGTVNMAPQPFMRPAADEEGQAVIDDLIAALTNQVERAKGRIARKAARQAARS